MNPNWDERYKAEEFAYGKAPNQFFKTHLSKFKSGKILMPADGEGRNGVFAATQGWQVSAFDLSREGKAKALKLAQSQKVELEYIVGDFDQLHFEASSFDAIGLIYAHFSADKKSVFHDKLDRCLKKGGIVILEAFSKKHLALRKQNPKVGGPTDIDMLYSKAEIEADFKHYEVIYLKEEEVELAEGQHHNGKSSVIRFIGRKKA